ncbi:hypothetical protein C0Q70_12405 [Pomacea canaliculata]|uniref:26S proteasome non-ATPase regulatory subunit 9 n=2 Tax=Pomacea canaliculata TaxID=400727 RepID=A0A2T7P1H3_POMCA|nr:hypothetical protein C0Q70_12405 [Pomacea canaliculata]
MKVLIQKKDAIESEIKEMSDVLESQKGVGMKGPLVDAEGYPRADIDIFSVRHARHRIACLQTDHTNVMKEIEEELHRIHLQVRQQRGHEEMPMEVSPAVSPSNQAQPFARIDRVDATSPAAVGGLEVGDEIVQFGSVSAENFRNLQQIGEVVQHSVGRPIRIQVLRNNQPLAVSITPGPWSGRGNLGCNIIAIKR